VVMAILGALVALAVPAMGRLGSAGSLNGAAAAIRGAFDQARTYAVANNTYTWVGIFEEDGAQEGRPSGKPGVGSLVICIVASRDGSPIYNKAQAEAGAVQTLTSDRLVQVGKPQRLPNVHVADLSGQAVGKRPAGMIQEQDRIGLATGAPLFSFRLPLLGGVYYDFGAGGGRGANGIVQFNPQGEAVSNFGTLSSPSANLEIALQEARGTRPLGGPNAVAIDVSGCTGQTTIYRP